MASKNKGGRLEVSKQFILDKRVAMVRDLIAKKWEKADIAILFNVHPSSITRIARRA